ncbi:MAG: hypothetical protein JNK88_02480 [Mangrovicoccus sp.]|nr:hypothetical protein [Mangrovicoccus sp.]
MSTTQVASPKPPVGPLLGADEAANLSLLFDPATAATDRIEGRIPDRRDETRAVAAAGAPASHGLLGWLRPVRAGARS